MMAPQLTKEERRAIAVMGCTMTHRATCNVTGRPLGTVSRVLKAHRETGRIKDAPLRVVALKGLCSMRKTYWLRPHQQQILF